MVDELIGLLARMFPSFQGCPPAEAQQRAEALGLFAARAWGAGPQAMQARGIPMPPEVHARLAPVAPRVAQAGQGGATFLVHLRQAVADDRRFAPLLGGFAKVYAESLGRGGAPAAPSGAGGYGPPVEPPAGGYGPPIEPSAPAPAPPSPAPAAAPPPTSQGGDGLDLDLAPEGAALGRAAPPAPAPAPAAPSSGGLDLDLAPEGALLGRDAPPPAAAPAAPTLDPSLLELLPDDPPPARPSYGAPEPAPSAAAPASDGLELGPGDEASGALSAVELLYAAPGAEEAALEGGGAPEDPAMRGFWAFERTGEDRYLDEAEQALRGELQRAPHATAAAMAEANLGKVALLRGDAAEAERLAKSALARDPSNPFGVEVLVRVLRGGAVEAAFNKALLRLRFALDKRDVSAIRQLAGGAIQQFPAEPLPQLALFFAAKVQGDEQAQRAALGEAWRRYPSAHNAHRAFGGAVDAELVEALLHVGRAPFKDMDAAGLRQTIEAVDSKENLIAGSLRMGVGLALVALTQGGLPREVQRRLWILAGQGMMGLQYYEECQPVLGKAMMLGPSEGETKLVHKERLQAQALWRAFDRPGIKAQKRFKCLGAQGMANTLQARLQSVLGDRRAREQELARQGVALAQRATQDPAIRAEVSAAAQAAGVADPLGPLAELDAELAQLAAEREGGAGEDAAKRAAPKKAGLFGMIKAAASTVSSAAKEASLKLKESQLAARREAAVKQLATALTRDLDDHEWQHPQLRAFARQAALNQAFLDYLEEEETRIGEQLKQLAQVV